MLDMPVREEGKKCRGEVSSPWAGKPRPYAAERPEILPPKSPLQIPGNLSINAVLSAEPMVDGSWICMLCAFNSEKESGRAIKVN